MWAALGAIGTLLMVGTQLVLFLRWLHRRMRDEEIIRRCVRDVAESHLPHIYKTLRLLARKQGIYDLEDPPAVQFVSFANGKHKR